MNVTTNAVELPVDSTQAHSRKKQRQAVYEVTDDIFAPHVDLIQQSLPGNLSIRLPSRMVLSQDDGEQKQALLVRVLQLANPPSLTVALYQCGNGHEACFVGSFSVESPTSQIAQEALHQHRRGAAPITLSADIQGYLIENLQSPSHPFRSVMWEQDALVYTLRWRGGNRQSALYTALSMVNSTPIRSARGMAARSPYSGADQFSLDNDSNGTGESQISQQPSELLQANLSPILSPITSTAVDAEVLNSDRLSSQELLNHALEPTPADLLAQNRPAQPERDRFQQEAPRPETPDAVPVIPIPPPEPEAPSTEPPLEGQENVTIFVNRLDVVGNSVLEVEINDITEPLEGRTVSLSELQNAVNEITALYLAQGYLTSMAILNPQTIDNGVVQIQVQEGGLEEIEVEFIGVNRLNPDYIRSRVALGAGPPLNVNDLEDQLRLLLADPLLEDIRPTLKRGENNQSILTVEVKEADPSQITFSFDNYSPPSIGSERLGINSRFLNPAGIGDELLASYYRSTTGGSNVFDIAYRLPLNPMDGAFQVEVESTRFNVTQPPFDTFDIRGSSQRYSVSYRQPIVRSPEEEFALTLGFNFRSGRTFLSDRPLPSVDGSDEDGISRTSVLGFGQDYVLRDPQGAWSFRSLFNIGTGLFDATQNPEPVPDGQFFSWLAQAQRIQVLNEDHLLLARLDMQLTPDTLLPSERFVIGGGQSVRGYRQNVRSGDNGVRLSVEDRITLLRDQPGAYRLIVAPFVDMGAVWNAAGNPNQIPSQQFLIGAGFGVLWEPFENFNVRADYGYPFINLRDRGNNLQDNGLHFSVDYRFEF